MLSVKHWQGVNYNAEYIKLACYIWRSLKNIVTNHIDEKFYGRSVIRHAIHLIVPRRNAKVSLSALQNVRPRVCALVSAELNG
jgi:hypothetical protein